MSFVATDPQSHKGQTDTWLTPLHLIPRIGVFDLDPCAFPNHRTAGFLITEKENGLKQKWVGRAKVFLNPPYSTAETWVDRLIEHGLGAALLFARTDSRWMQRAIKSCDHIQFIKGRVSFIKPDSMRKTTNAGSPSIVLYFGMQPCDPSLGAYL